METPEHHWWIQSSSLSIKPGCYPKLVCCMVCFLLPFTPHFQFHSLVSSGHCSQQLYRLLLWCFFWLENVILCDLCCRISAFSRQINFACENFEPPNTHHFSFIVERLCAELSELSSDYSWILKFLLCLGYYLCHSQNIRWLWYIFKEWHVPLFGWLFSIGSGGGIPILLIPYLL